METVQFNRSLKIKANRVDMYPQEPERCVILELTTHVQINILRRKTRALMQHGCVYAPGKHTTGKDGETASQLSHSEVESERRSILLKVPHVHQEIRSRLLWPSPLLLQLQGCVRLGRFSGPVDTGRGRGSYEREM